LKKKLRHESASMDIQRLTRSDYDGIIELWSRAGLPFKPKGRDSKKAMAAQIQTNPDFFWELLKTATSSVWSS